MNTLSWVIYVADVLPRFVAGMSLSLLFLCLVLIFYQIGATIANECNGFTWGKNLVVMVSMFFIVLLSFIPTRDAIFMIAASEISEKVIVSEEGKQIREIIKLEMQRKISDLQKTPNR